MFPITEFRQYADTAAYRDTRLRQATPPAPRLPQAMLSRTASGQGGIRRGAGGGVKDDIS
jgi:hypothetical protein